MLLHLDTGPLKGLLDSHDQMHEQAKMMFADAEMAGARPICPYPALLELHRLLMYRKPRRSDAAIRSHAALAQLIKRYPVVHTQANDHIDALALLARYPDQTITLADATIAAMAKRSKGHKTPPSLKETLAFGLVNNLT